FDGRTESLSSSLAHLTQLRVSFGHPAQGDGKSQREPQDWILQRRMKLASNHDGHKGNKQRGRRVSWLLAIADGRPYQSCHHRPDERHEDQHAEHPLLYAETQQRIVGAVVRSPVFSVDPRADAKDRELAERLEGNAQQVTPVLVLEEQTPISVADPDVEVPV